MDNLIIRTSLGDLKGVEYTTAEGEIINTFQGIRYGEPPIGKLRFKSPIPARKWEGVKEALAPGNIAPFIHTPGRISELPESEDCLFLNVFTPKGSDGPMPVMVWIHGGAFKSGSGSMVNCGPDYLVPLGIVLVTINYRLGPFGFLSLDVPECPGNFGLKDQSLALRWVNENISVFGGDPSNITLFGESAGAGSVHYHLASPLSRGLFHKAILQSGCCLNRWALSRTPRKSAMTLAKRLGCTSDRVEDALEILLNATTDEIINNQKGIFEEVEGIWSVESAVEMAFSAVLEPASTLNPFFTKQNWDEVHNGKIADVPVIFGFNSSENTIFLPNAEYVPPDNIEFYKKMLPKELDLNLNSQEVEDAAEKLRLFYFPSGPTQNSYIKATSALIFGYGIIKSAVAASRMKKTPTYLYHLIHSRADSWRRKFFGVSHITGSSHGEDLGFLFTAKVQPPLVKNSHDKKVQEIMCKLWTDFAKGCLTDTWPAVQEDESNVDYLEIGPTTLAKKGLIEEEISFWDGIYESLRAKN